jgi:hypothetical protein
MDSIDPPDYPTGKSRIPLSQPFPMSSPSRKNILISRNRKSVYIHRHPVPLEGRFAIVTDAGWDAVDVDALLTNGAEADGEVVWS